MKKNMFTQSGIEKLGEFYKELNTVEVLFAKVNKNAKIPSKRIEDAGWDIYACFEEKSITIYPNDTVLIPTGIASAFDNNWHIELKERGSTGTKAMSRRAGIIDSGFRNEWKVVINNTSRKPIIICKDIELSKKEISDDLIIMNYNPNEIEEILNDYVFYPYDKAICQAVLYPVPKTIIKEVTYEELLSIKSERGLGMLGSSKK